MVVVDENLKTGSEMEMCTEVIHPQTSSGIHPDTPTILNLQLGDNIFYIMHTKTKPKH